MIQKRRLRQSCLLLLQTMVLICLMNSAQSIATTNLKKMITIPRFLNERITDESRVEVSFSIRLSDVDTCNFYYFYGKILPQTNKDSHIDFLELQLAGPSITKSKCMNRELVQREFNIVMPAVLLSATREWKVKVPNDVIVHYHLITP